MRTRTTIAFGMLLGALALAPAAQAKGTVYSTGNSNELQAKPIAADGALGTGTAFPTGSAVTPRAIAITPNAQFLYMTTTSNNFLGFNIAGATPTQVAGSPYNVTDNFGLGLAITPNGQFVYSLNTNGGAGSLSIFAIGSNGSLTKVGANVPLGYQGDGVAIAPNGQALYITDTTTNTVRSYAIAADGTVSPIGTPRATGNGPRGVAVAPSGSHVFTGASAGGQLSSFPVQADGSLGAATSTVATGLNPQTLAVTQNGQFLYSASFPSNPGRILAYAIGGDGSRQRFPASPLHR
jgi:6-phosphogluconolactonase